MMKKTDKTPTGMISRSDAWAMTGWSRQHFARVMKDSGVTAVGKNFVLAEFMDFFARRTKVVNKPKTREKTPIVVCSKDLVAAVLKATE